MVSVDWGGFCSLVGWRDVLGIITIRNTPNRRLPRIIPRRRLLRHHRQIPLRRPPRSSPTNLNLPNFNSRFQKSIHLIQMC